MFFCSFINAQKKSIEYRTAQLNIYGYVVSNPIGINERVFKKKLINLQQSNKKNIVLGSSRVMKLGSDVLKSKSVLNLGVSMASLEDVIGLYFIARKKGITPKKVYLGLDPAIFFSNSDRRWEKVYKKEYTDFVSNKYLNNKENIKDLPRKVKLNKKAKLEIIKTIYPLANYKYKRVDFKGEYKLDSLFKTFYSTTKNIQFEVNDTINYINQFITSPSFYESISDFEELFLNNSGNCLVEETKSYRSKHFDKLSSHQQNNIMKLNRILLELVYGFPESSLKDDFPSLSNYNLAFSKLIDGTITYAHDYENMSKEKLNLKLKKEIKTPLSIRPNQKLNCPKKEVFENFISFIQSEGVQVHFVLPPFHPKLYASLIKNAKFSFLEIFQSYIFSLANEKDIIVHGNFNPNELGCIESDFHDGNHIRKIGLKKVIKKRN